MYIVLVALANVLVHQTYTLNLGANQNGWFKKLSYRHDLAWCIHLIGLFGPSFFLIVFWAKWKGSVWHVGVAVALAVPAYYSWQPLALNLLSAWEQYPTHLEAFRNFSYRNDWLLYE